MIRIPISRVPIKIRKPIYKDFCDCWDINVLSVNGIPQLVSADRLNIEQLRDLLQTIDFCTTVFFSRPIEECRYMVELVLSFNIPVMIKTNKVIPDDIVQKIGEVPHSAITVSMGFLDDFTRNSLEKGSGEVKPLRKMMFLAKSLKIFVSLWIDYQPHLMKRLDLFEIMEMTKMLASHVMVTFPSVLDDYRFEMHKTWSSVNPEYMQTFRHCYQADVPRRSWVIKDVIKKEFINSFNLFAKTKKLTMEVMECISECGRMTRHVASSVSPALPLGIRPFNHIKCTETAFVEYNDAYECQCPRCGKSVF